MVINTNLWCRQDTVELFCIKRKHGELILGARQGNWEREKHAWMEATRERKNQRIPEKNEHIQ